MCFFCGGHRKTHFVLALMLAVILFSLGLALSILGEASHRLEMCQVEPSLNLWMMTAGKTAQNIALYLNALNRPITFDDKKPEYGGLEEKVKDTSFAILNDRF